MIAVIFAAMLISGAIKDSYSPKNKYRQQYQDELIPSYVCSAKKKHGERMRIYDVVREHGNIMVKYKTKTQWFYATAFIDFKCDPSQS